MMGPVSEQRLALVHPKLSDLIHQLAEQLSEPIGVTQGLRTEAEQAALYWQGRASLAVVNQKRQLVNWAPLDPDENIHTVTEAKPGYSWHQFGLAVDVAPFESSGVVDWNESHPVWNEIIQKGEALGLTSGISWRDEPHFQLTGRFPVTPTDEARMILMTQGINGVWIAANITGD